MKVIEEHWHSQWHPTLPTLFAATSPDAQLGEYYGPDKFGEIRGYPTIAKVPEQWLDEGGCGAVSEALVRVRFGAVLLGTQLFLNASMKNNNVPAV